MTHGGAGRDDHPARNRLALLTPGVPAMVVTGSPLACIRHASPPWTVERLGPANVLAPCR